MPHTFTIQTFTIQTFTILTFTNGILPLTLLVGLSILLPMLLAGPTLSQQRLTLAMLATILMVWIAGAALMAAQYYQSNGSVSASPMTYFQRALPLGLLYGPVLALIWLIRAQGVEKRRGLQMQDKG